MKNPLKIKSIIAAAFSMLIGVTGCSQSIGAFSVMDPDRRARIDHVAGVAWVIQPQTPEAAAKGLFSAWQQNDKTSAAKYAVKKAIAYLFDLSNSKDKFEFESCSKYGGGMHCWFRHSDGGSLNLTMTRTGKSWRVNSMEFVDIS